MVLFSFFIPLNINITCLYKNNKRILFLTNTNFYFILVFNTFKAATLNKKSNSLIIKQLKNQIINKNTLAKLELFLKTWHKYTLNKIKFTGKGFKITKLKQNNLVKLFFGKSHIT